MKRFTLILAAAFALLTACHNNEEAVPAQEKGRIAFEVTNYQQYSLDDETRGETVSVDSVKHLDMAVYGSEGQSLVLHQHQAKGDEGYGSFSGTLPYGEYDIVFLGYEGSRQADVEHIASICFPDNFVPNFFYRTLHIVIDAPEQEAQPVVLQRAVGAFRLVSTGTTPSTLSTLAFTSQGGSHHFNALTGAGAVVESRTYTYNVANQVEKDTLSVTFFTFLTTPTATMSFTVTARDGGGSIIRSREFNDVPMKVNQRTQYAGQFFADPSASPSFTLSVEDKAWEDVKYNY